LKTNNNEDFLRQDVDGDICLSYYITNFLPKTFEDQLGFLVTTKLGGDSLFFTPFLHVSLPQCPHATRIKIKIEKKKNDQHVLF
jgi:hypothetical protein